MSDGVFIIAGPGPTHPFGQVGSRKPGEDLQRILLVKPELELGQLLHGPERKKVPKMFSEGQCIASFMAGSGAGAHALPPIA